MSWKRIAFPASAGLVALLLGPQVHAAATTATVIAVEAARGLITAVERSSGDIFVFGVKDKNHLALFRPCTHFDVDLASVKAGQAFTADLGPMAAAKVSAAAPCCTMTSAPGTAGRVLGIQPHGKFEGLDIMLMEIKRTEGNLATATCLYCNGGTTRLDLAADLRARASNAKLLDLTNQVAHEVVRPGGPGGNPMVSDHGPGLKLDPNRAVRTWMTFSAPAGNTVTLHVPGVSAPFANVTIAK